MNSLLPELTIETVDTILESCWRGDQSLLAPYRNHVLRMTSFCQALNGAVDAFELGVAGAFHDLGVWVVPTWDYLKPTRELAHAWLRDLSRSECGGRVDAMIEYHHKLTRYRGPHEDVVESFRRADWIDVSRGRLRFGLSAALVESIVKRHPKLGFHAFLRKRLLQAFTETPLRPLPMFHW